MKKTFSVLIIIILLAGCGSHPYIGRKITNGRPFVSSGHETVKSSHGAIIDYDYNIKDGNLHIKGKFTCTEDSKLRNDTANDTQLRIDFVMIDAQDTVIDVHTVFISGYDICDGNNIDATFAHNDNAASIKIYWKLYYRY